MLNPTKEVIHQVHIVYSSFVQLLLNPFTEMKYHYPCVLSLLLTYHIIKSWDRGLFIVSFLFISGFVALELEDLLETVPL